jgi:hypothetical protein
MLKIEALIRLFQLFFIYPPYRSPPPGTKNEKTINALLRSYNAEKNKESRRLIQIQLLECTNRTKLFYSTQIRDSGADDRHSYKFYTVVKIKIKIILVFADFATILNIVCTLYSIKKSTRVY